MDKSLEQLEDELKSLRLRDPSPQLVDRLTRELVAETDDLSAPAPRYAAASSFPSWKWLGWRAAGLAAVLAFGTAVILMNFGSRPASAPPASLIVTDTEPAESHALTERDPLQAVAATNVLYDLKDEGLVNVGEGQSVRQVRARYVDTYTWTNRRNNSSLKWTVPRDEIRVIPASFH